MNTVKRRKKRAYLLLELLIAIAVLSLFLAPMLRSPFSYLKKQREEVTSLYLTLEAEKILIEIEEDLRTGRISWDQIALSQKEKVFIKSFSKNFFPDQTFPKVETSIFLSKAYIKKLESGTLIGKVQVVLEFLAPKNKKELLRKVESVFFVSKKKLEKTVVPQAPLNAKDLLSKGDSLDKKS